MLKTAKIPNGFKKEYDEVLPRIKEGKANNYLGLSSHPEVIKAVNHMSIVDGIAMSNAKVKIFTHNDMDKLEYILKNSQEFSRRLIVVDGVYSMDGDMACLDEISALAEKYDAAVMVDEAHSIGFFGETGRGVSEHFGLEDKIAVKMTTFSKSLAGVGGCIASDSDTIDYLKHQAHQYIFNASLPPAVVAGVLKSLELMQKETWRREKLWENTIRFKGFN